MRRSTIFFMAIAVQTAIAIFLVIHSVAVSRDSGRRLELEAGFVSSLSLTDIALFTEARYTRHPAMADYNTPFQDYPFSLEHFPSGSIMRVPVTLRK